MPIQMHPENDPNEFAMITIVAQQKNEAQFKQDKSDYRIWLAQTGYTMLRQDEPDIDNVSNEDYIKTIGDIAEKHEAKEQRIGEINTEIHTLDNHINNKAAQKCLLYGVVPPVIGMLGGGIVANSFGMDAHYGLLSGIFISVPSIYFAVRNFKREVDKTTTLKKPLEDERHALHKLPDSYNDTLMALDALRDNKADQLKKPAIRQQADMIVTTLANKLITKDNQPS